MNLMLKLAIIFVHVDNMFFSFGLQVACPWKLLLFSTEIAAITTPVRRIHQFLEFTILGPLCQTSNPLPPQI